MSYYGYAPYVSVAERRLKAEKAAAKAKKSGAIYAPIASYRGAIAKTFWGQAWCDNLEHYSDYANRLPRGRTYTRNGSVIDLQIGTGEVKALVMGSNLYTIKVTVAAVLEKQWQAMGADCAGSIDSLVGLLQGKLSQPVMERICRPGTGLFPAKKDIKFSCSCPDSAAMCKHVAATLYGVGARLDQQPALLFTLRGVEANDLVSQAGAAPLGVSKRPAASKVLGNDDLAEMFGIEMAQPTVLAPSKVKAKPTLATKSAPRMRAKRASKSKK